MSDLKIKTLKKNLFHVECVTQKAIKIFNKVVFGITDIRRSAVVSAYCKSLIISKLKWHGLKIKNVSISKEAKKFELEYYERVRLG